MGKKIVILSMVGLILVSVSVVSGCACCRFVSGPGSEPNDSLDYCRNSEWSTDGNCGGSYYRCLPSLATTNSAFSFW